MTESGSPADVERMLKEEPEALKECGGEFLLAWDGCTARDTFGIMPGPVPPGTVCCGSRTVARIAPDPLPCTLEEAIITAVSLRSDEGMVAFSGGVDSGLIAGLARLLRGGGDCGVARHHMGDKDRPDDGT